VSARRPEAGELSHAGALRTLLRALRYLAPFRRRVRVKLGLGVLSVLPLLLLPWPVKVVVDQVIEGIPPAESKVPWPFFLRPLVAPLEGASPAETLLAALGFQGLLLLLVGAIGLGGREQDQTDAWLASGHDTATRTENEANAGFSLAGGLLGWLDFRWTLRLVQDLNHHYRALLFERIQALPMSAFDDERIGDALYRVMYDAPSITNGCFRILLTPLLATLVIALTVAALAASFGADATIVASGLALLPLSLAVTLPFAAALRRRATASRRAGAGTTATAEEGLANVLAVQSLGGEGRESARFDRDSWESFSAWRSLARMVLLAVAVGVLPVLLVVGNAFLHAVDRVVLGEVSRGDFVLLLTYFAILAGAAFEIGAFWFRVQGSAAGLERVFFLMDMPGERDAPGARPLAALRRGIRLEGVEFAWGDGPPVVRGVDLELRVGRVTALVGPAGAGKTTLAWLACGFLQPTRGRVLVDGADLRGFTRASLRQKLAYVFQETALFDDSVAANIRLGKPDASEAELERAARRAGADEFIRALPQGYQTGLGRAGGRLSVGQKQRLAIARALVRDAPVLVLDEPTSALDAETEARLLESLRELARERAVLLIAHRPSTVRAADEICFVEGGRIAERGSHAELLARPGGAWRRFVELQAHGVG
jgi:ABC-type multidrug transport system fused ATPase/permease subunit